MNEDRLIERKLMVEKTIVSRGISDSLVLDAMLSVPRHRFVPSEYREMAYNDSPVPIGEGQTISQPYIVALMTELAGISSQSEVLEIGSGSGYQAAILGEIADSVFTIEIIPELAKRASSILDSLEYDNIVTRCGDGYSGWPDKALFDAIIVTAAPDHIPQPLVDQLKVGGRMIIPVGSKYQQLKIVIKTEHGDTVENNIPVRFVPMTGKALDLE